jgi:hypothetical protein
LTRDPYGDGIEEDGVAGGENGGEGVVMSGGLAEEGEVIGREE